MPREEANSSGLEIHKDSDRNDRNEVALLLAQTQIDPEHLAASLMVQQDFTFHALKQLVSAIPLKKKTTHRATNGGKGRRIQGMVAGLWTHGSQTGVAKTALKWPKTITYINRFMEQHGGGQWSSFVLLKNVQTKIHKDNHNTPGSMVKTMTFGDFSGGELWVAAQGEHEAGSKITWTKDHKGTRRAGYLIDTYEKPYDLDPKVEHATRPWKGERWCLSFYSSRGAEGANQRCRRQLKKLGFPLMKNKSARTFGIIQDTIKPSPVQEPREIREGVDSKARRTPHQSRFSDSVVCVPPTSEPDHGIDSGTEAQGGVHECHSGSDSPQRDRVEGPRCHPAESNLGGSETKEAASPATIELEAKGPGGVEAVVPRSRDPRLGAADRLSLVPLGKSKAGHGNRDLGGDGQGDGHGRRSERLVRGSAAMCELLDPDGGSQEPP